MKRKMEAAADMFMPMMHRVQVPRQCVKKRYLRFMRLSNCCRKGSTYFINQKLMPFLGEPETICLGEPKVLSSSGMSSSSRQRRRPPATWAAVGEDRIPLIFKWDPSLNVDSSRELPCSSHFLSLSLCGCSGSYPSNDNRFTPSDAASF